MGVSYEDGRQFWAGYFRKVLIMMTRKQKVEELVRNELEWLIGNPERHNLTDAIDFFTAGGFHTWTDKKVDEAFSRLDVSVEGAE